MLVKCNVTAEFGLVVAIPVLRTVTARITIFLNLESWNFVVD